MDDKITLDRNTFKALAADTRISILKELDIRRKTQSELANTLGMSNSTIKEHLGNLESVDLVKQIDEGYKWKYYELTKKGKNIVSPSEKKIFISLALAILALVAATNNLITRLANRTSEKASQLTTAINERAASDNTIAISEAQEAPARIIEYTQSQPIPYPDIILTITIAIILGILIGYLIKSRK